MPTKQYVKGADEYGILNFEQMKRFDESRPRQVLMCSWSPLLNYSCSRESPGLISVAARNRWW